METRGSWAYVLIWDIALVLMIPEFHVVVSLSGVVLIARPTFLFGGSGHMDAGVGAGGPTVTPAQRMIAVWYATTTPCSLLFPTRTTALPWLVYLELHACVRVVLTFLHALC